MHHTNSDSPAHRRERTQSFDIVDWIELEYLSGLQTEESLVDTSSSESTTSSQLYPTGFEGSNLDESESLENSMSSDLETSQEMDTFPDIYSSMHTINSSRKENKRLWIWKKIYKHHPVMLTVLLLVIVWIPLLLMMMHIYLHYQSSRQSYKPNVKPVATLPVPPLYKLGVACDSLPVNLGKKWCHATVKEMNTVAVQLQQRWRQDMFMTSTERSKVEHWYQWFQLKWDKTPWTGAGWRGFFKMDQIDLESASRATCEFVESIYNQFLTSLHDFSLAKTRSDFSERVTSWIAGLYTHAP